MESTLTVYEREGRSFEEIFGKSAERAIKAMDAAMDDIPNQDPDFNLPVPSVGVRRKAVPVVVCDLLNGGGQRSLTCEVDVMTGLPPSKRGIHMSRVGDCIARLADQSFRDLQDYTAALAEAVGAVEYGEGTVVDARSIYSYREPVPGYTPEKNKFSLENIGVHASTLYTPGDSVQKAGITVVHITACPCVQQTVRHGFGLPKGGNLPFLTHSQRSRTTVGIEGIRSSLSIERLLRVMDSVVFRVQNTLPREHEAALVYSAHAKPQFIEDVVRQAAAACHVSFATEFPDGVLYVSSVSEESIHDFDIAAELQFPMAQLTDLLS